MGQRGRPRVVVDTGVLVSAFAFGGTPARVLRRVLARAEICVSQPILDEYRGVPERLFVARKITRPQLEALLSGIASFVADAKVIVTAEQLEVCRDPKDDVLLDIDRASLRAVGLERLRIVTAAALLQRLK